MSLWKPTRHNNGEGRSLWTQSETRPQVPPG